MSLRGIVFLFMGLLELILALVLVQLGREIPSPSEVEHSFSNAQRVTDRAGDQVQLLHSQVQSLRRLEIQQLADRLQRQTRAVSGSLRTQSVDFDTVCTLRDALGEVAEGLTGLADTLDPGTIGKLSNGLRETAAFLDEKVIPNAEKAADHLDESTASLRTDAKRLSALLKESPLDLRTVRAIYDSLGHFQEGIDRMNGTIKTQRLDTMREGFLGLETSLVTGSEQVERLSGYTFPVVSFSGLRPEIHHRQFWPDGDKIAEGMRKAAAGAIAAGKQLDDMAEELPHIRASLGESSKVIGQVRKTLATALTHQEKVEPLLKEIPAHASRLAEELPKLGGDLSRMLRDTQRLKDVASALRQAQTGIDKAVGRWPEVRTTIARLATALRAARNQLNQATEHRQEYEAAMGQTVQLADTFAAMLPLITDQLDGRLDEEEQTLSDLGSGLDEAREAIPTYARTTSRLLQTARILAWLVAGIIGLHGCYLLAGVRLGRRYTL
jgi:uncharacterized phage infection (PIP) family protein YhgE